MDYLLRCLAVLLLAAGVPFFLALGTALGTLASLGGPEGDSSEKVTKFLMLYGAFGLAGLLSAAGGILWAVVNIAYPRKSRAVPCGPSQPTG